MAVDLETRRQRGREYMRNYYARNPEKAREASKLWKSKNPEWMREYRRAWRLRNKEAVHRNARAWNRANAEKCRAHKRTAHDKNPGIDAANRARQRAKKQGVGCDLTAEWYQAEYAKGCAISGLPFAPRSRLKLQSASIDRIKAGGDYTRANCRLILNCLNIGLNKWGLENVLPIWRVVVGRNLASDPA